MAADGTDGYRDVEPAAWYYEAVDWARVNGIIGGDRNVFDPQGEITRAETASMLYHWRADGEEENVTVNENDGILIAYFSHTGNTRGVAGDIAGITGGDVFEIVPLEPYPEDYDAIAERSQAELAAALARLPEQTQEEIFRYYFMRQPQRVIGVHIGRTRSTSGRHIQLALQRLRRLMEGKDHE